MLYPTPRDPTLIQAYHRNLHLLCDVSNQTLKEIHLLREKNITYLRESLEQGMDKHLVELRVYWILSNEQAIHQHLEKLLPFLPQPNLFNTRQAMHAMSAASFLRTQIALLAYLDHHSEKELFQKGSLWEKEFSSLNLRHDYSLEIHDHLIEEGLTTQSLVSSIFEELQFCAEHASKCLSQSCVILPPGSDSFPPCQPSSEKASSFSAFLIKSAWVSTNHHLYHYEEEEPPLLSPPTPLSETGWRQKIWRWIRNFI